LEAALRAGRFPLAWALAGERFELKPSSERNSNFLARARQGLEETKATSNEDRLDRELVQAS